MIYDGELVDLYCVGDLIKEDVARSVIEDIKKENLEEVMDIKFSTCENEGKKEYRFSICFEPYTGRKNKYRPLKSLDKEYKQKNLEGKTQGEK